MVTIPDSGRFIRAFYPSQRLLVPLERSTVVPLLLWTPTWKSLMIRALLKGITGELIDVGANIGQTLFDFAHSGVHRKYWAIEPNPNCVRIIRQIIERNSLVDCNVLEIGLFDVEATMPFWTSPRLETDTRATVRRSLWPGQACGESRVSVIPFDVLRHRCGIGNIGLIKIDVEGAELEVLAGMKETLSEDRPPVICEVLLMYRSSDVGEYHQRVASIIKLLQGLEYDIYRIGKGAPRPFLKDGPLKEFPIRVWNQFTRGQCDYFFMPREQTQRIQRLIRIA